MRVNSHLPQQLLDAVVEGSSDSIIVVDRVGQIIFANPAVSMLFGYRVEELLGIGIDRIVPKLQLRDAADHLERLMLDPHLHQIDAGPDLEGVHRDGYSLDVEIVLRPIQTAESDFLIAFIRNGGESQRQADWLRAVSVITQRLLNGSDMSDVFEYIAARSRALARAEASWVVTPSESGQLVICAADGPGTASLIGVELSAESSRSAMALESGVAAIVDDLSSAGNVPSQVTQMNLGSGAYLPLISDGRRLGLLVLARSKHGAPFDPLDIALAEVFASATASAMRLGEERKELNRLIRVEEDERIARDLHDTVIQQLFAVGMSLQAVRSDATGQLGERIDIAVDRLDDVIRDIRNTIFRLPRRTRQIEGLREEMFNLAERYAYELGFTPRIDFHGPVEAAIPDDVADHLLQVLSEALSNISRHAQASSVRVRVSIEHGWLAVLVTDDGVGLADVLPEGNGLRNMMARAAALGGMFKIENHTPSGTEVEWKVPIQF